MDVLFYKETLSAAAVALTLVAFAPYIRAIVSGTATPHVFSWIIWGATTFIVFLAQREAKGGVGAWPVGFSSGVTIFIAILAYIKRTDIAINKTDWSFFILALLSLPLWYLTSEPLWAVVMLTIIDVLGFGPTFRKVYRHPHSESRVFFAVIALRNVLIILALENYSVTTILFPAVIAVACFSLLLMVEICQRRKC